MHGEACSDATVGLGALYAPIATDLERVRQVLADELISDQAFISDLCGHTRQFHGKLLRPALLLLTAQACGGVRPAHHVLAAVIELVHLATLVHDDVLDEADIRRRAATVNRLWGNQRAVLMGDFLYSHAFHMCASVRDDRLPPAYAARVIGQTAITVCEGEMMQVANRGNFALTEAEYLDFITRKTAVLGEASCHLGACFAGADEATVKAWGAYGTGLGVAFQMIDDLLDLTGEQSQVGKSIGRDLCEGELTLPLIHCLREAPPDARARLISQLSGLEHSPDPECTREIVALLRQSGSLAYAMNVATSHVQRARAEIGRQPASAARDCLRTLADFVLSRRV